MMKIQLAGLAEGVQTLRFALPAPDAGLDDRFTGDVSVEAEVHRRGHEYLLKAKIAAAGFFPCDRCLEPFRMTVTPAYVMYYVADGAERTDFDPAEVHVLPAGETVVDITEDVRQTVLLDVPQKLLCREDCLGLCPTCGVNRNDRPCACAADRIDPRWEKLKDLRR